MTQLVWVAGLDFSPEVPFSGTIRRGEISARLLHQTGPFLVGPDVSSDFPHPWQDYGTRIYTQCEGTRQRWERSQGQFCCYHGAVAPHTSPPKTQFSFGDWGNSVGIREQVPTLLLVWVMLKSPNCWGYPGLLQLCRKFSLNWRSQ